GERAVLIEGGGAGGDLEGGAGLVGDVDIVQGVGGGALELDGAEIVEDAVGDGDVAVDVQHRGGVGERPDIDVAAGIGDRGVGQCELHSFPTRRSSDLGERAVLIEGGGAGGDLE